ncbi:MAG: hypothetical protein H7067_11165 [Burkholderiales bacterium]|nr:hypothetical protein [Opitutaceae bacterium]
MLASPLLRLVLVGLLLAPSLQAADKPQPDAPPVAESPAAASPVPSSPASPVPVVHVDDPAHLLPAGSAAPAAWQARLAAFEQSTGIRVIVCLRPASPNAEEDAKPGNYMRTLSATFEVARGGALAVYFADEPDWRLWIGDELTARFAAQPGAATGPTNRAAIHDAKELVFAAALKAAEQAAPEDRLAVQTTALIDSLLARLAPR